MRRSRLPVLALMLVCVSPLASGAAEPANPHASPKARAILNYLEALPKKTEKRLASGQFAGFGSGASLRSLRRGVQEDRPLASPHRS